MSGFLHVCMATVNDVGRAFCAHAAGVFVQSGVLIAALLIADLVLRSRVRATVRYWIWMLVIIKLLLPPTLSLPTGVGHWLGQYVTSPAPAARQVLETAEPYEVPGQVLSPATPVPQSSAGVETARAEPVESAAAPAERLTWQGGAVLLWGLGVLGFIGLVLRRVFFVRGLVAQGHAAQGDPVDLLDECCRRMDIHRHVAMRLLPGAFSPAVCGLRRPTILLPETLLTRLSPDNLRAVLIHELAHVKRADLWVNCLQTILQVIYFYNPLVWLANAIVRRVREQAVDEMSLVALGAEARSYGDMLIDVAEMAFWRANPALGLVGVAESKKSLEGRIRHMITRPIPKHAKVGATGALVIAVVGALVLPMATARTNGERAGFMADLPGGVTVELVGVCNWPTSEQTCWQPDGSKLEPPLRVTKWNYPPGANSYGFMLKITGPEDLQRNWRKSEGAVGWEAGCDVVDRQGNRLDHYTAVIMLFEKAPAETTLEAGLATGPWNTIATDDRRDRRRGDHPDVLWSQAFETSAGTSIVASTVWDNGLAHRVIAIDTEGAVHTTQQAGSTASGSVEQFTATFPGLRRDRIRQFQYQVRPFEWVRFKGISLRPGQRSVVTVDETTPHTGGALAGGDKAAARQEYSRTRLANLGKAVLLYANDHADQLPQRMENVREHLNGAELEWLLANVTYLGKDLSMSDYPGRVVAYDKTLLIEGRGTNVLYLDSHVDFEKPPELERLGIPSGRRDAMMRTYEVNRSVPDFPRAQDFSTPEAAYATINRIDQSDPAAWQKVSVAAVAERFKREGGQRKKTAANPEWAKVLSDARILQVMVWNNTRAAVIARLPQELSSQKIAAPIDVRYLELENGRWLNTGNDRFWTVEEGNATFMARSEGAQRKAAEEPEIDSVAAMGHLKQLALAAIMYAEDHKGSFASDLAELKPYFGDDTRFAQIREEVVYLGKGVKRDEVASPAARPLAYRKTATTNDGMVVAFFDGHVEIVKGDRLTKLGITPKP